MHPQPDCVSIVLFIESQILLWCCKVLENPITRQMTNCRTSFKSVPSFEAEFYCIDTPIIIAYTVTHVLYTITSFTTGTLFVELYAITSFEVALFCIDSITSITYTVTGEEVSQRGFFWLNSMQSPPSKPHPGLL